MRGLAQYLRIAENQTKVGLKVLNELAKNVKTAVKIRPRWD
ncbi:hypothetical protein [Candidatus Alkanophaga liquidiphilum]